MLARYQGKANNDWRDEEPGKILHEYREGEMTRDGEMPFGPYYGSVDATPLFLILLSETFNWTADEQLVEELLPNAYVHSILILMLWILPINLPILVVWVHNLAVHWLTPFSSHHNVLSIMPFILLVETLTSGKMVPRVTSRLRHLTSVFFFCIGIYAAVYGVTYAYMLHYLVNFVAAWLVAIHSSTSTWTLSSLSTMFEAENADTRKRGKTP